MTEFMTMRSIEHSGKAESSPGERTSTRESLPNRAASLARTLGAASTRINLAAAAPTVVGVQRFAAAVIEDDRRIRRNVGGNPVGYHSVVHVTMPSTVSPVQ